MSSDDRKKIKLKEFAELVNQPYQPSSGENFNYIGLEHIEQQTLRINGIGNSSDVISQKHRFNAGDILFGKLRPYFRKVVRPSFDGVCSTDIWVVRAKPGFDQSFLFYFLANQSFIDACNSSSSGTRMPRADWNHLSETLWELPSLPEQKRIAEILSALDDKIELNRQTNATLEAIAQAIFKEWFVDFNYPGATGEMVDSELGPIPKGWQVVQIGKLFDFALGGDWGSETEQNKGDILCGVIRGTDFENLSNGFVDGIPQRYIKQKSLIKRRLREGDIIIEISGGSKNQATGRNLRVSSEILDLFDRPIVPTSFCRLIRPENIDISLFLGTFLSSFYKAGGTWDYQLQSTGISNFQFNDFSIRQKIVLPDTQALHNFSQIAYSLFSLRGENSKNNNSLTSALNLLLPKLLSGSLSSFEISESQFHKE